MGDSCNAATSKEEHHCHPTAAPRGIQGSSQPLLWKGEMWGPSRDPHCRLLPHSLVAAACPELHLSGAGDSRMTWVKGHTVAVAAWQVLEEPAQSRRTRDLAQYTKAAAY